MKDTQYEKIAKAWLKKELDAFSGPFHARVRKFKSDYRMSSVPKSETLYCESGGLYTTTPEKPSEYIRVKTLNGNKTLAKFAIEFLAKYI